MDFEVLITVFVTMFLGVAGFVVNTILQRKNNSIKIITQYRIDRKNATQEITAKLLAYTDPHYYEALDEQEKDKNVQIIVVEISKLRSIYYFSFQRDAEFVEAAYTLKKLFCATHKNWEKIDAARARFAQLSDIYTSTDWKRIKLETVGKGVRNDRFLPKWTEIFDANEAYFKKQDQVNTDIFRRDEDGKNE